MTGKNKSPPDQTSMFEAFEKAEFEQKTAHMPSKVEEAKPFYRSIIDRYNAAILSGEPEKADRIRQEAEDLAVRLNDGTHFGIKGDSDAPCYVLERATAAESGNIPLWGQTGSFVLDVKGCKVRVEFSGLYGICIPQFSAHAVALDRPFISETGYRSFMAHRFDCKVGGITVERYVRETIEAHIARGLKGKLVPIAARYRSQQAAQPEP